MIDLRQIGSVAPSIDLTAGVLLMFAAALFALGLVASRMFRQSLLAAFSTLLLSALAMLGAAAFSMSHPRSFYVAGLVYVAAFALIAHVASLGFPDKRTVRRALVWGSATMLLAIALAWWLAFAPR